MPLSSPDEITDDPDTGGGRGNNKNKTSFAIVFFVTMILLSTPHAATVFNTISDVANMPDFLPGVVRGETYVSGDITSDTTWDAVNGPYYINGTVTVQQGATLRIESGVSVFFNTSAAIYVNGTLIADGVVFENASSGTSWNGITFNQGSSGSITGSFFRNATAGLVVKTGDVVVDGVVFENCHVGVDVEYSSPAINNITAHQPPSAGSVGIKINSTIGGVVGVKNVTVDGFGSDGYGIYTENADFKISCGNITGAGYGLYIAGSAGLVENSTFKNTGINPNVFLKSRGGVPSNVTLLNVTDNRAPGFGDAVSNATIRWCVRIKAVNNRTGDPLGNVSVWLNTTGNTSDGKYHVTTGVGGEAWTNVISERRNISGVFADYNPYSITAARKGYHTYTTTANFSSYTYLEIRLDPVDIDLSPTNYTLYLTDPPTTHLYGEALEISVDVTNTGTDNATDVPVYFYDSTDGNSFTLSDADLIPGVGGNGDTGVAWGRLENLSPGNHTILIDVDPHNTTLDLDPSNNTLQTIWFRVNVPPGVNITYPAPHETLNHTVTVTGYVWDNISDEDNDTPTVTVYLERNSSAQVVVNATLDTSNATDINGSRAIPWTALIDTKTVDDGQHNITAFASDGVHYASFSVPVYTDNNQPPTLTNLAYPKVVGGKNVSFTISVNYTDPEGTVPAEITVNITLPSTGWNETYNMTYDDSQNDTLGFTPSPYPNGTYTCAITLPEKGNYTFHIYASDGENTLETEEKNITVLNTPPSISDYYPASAKVRWGDVVNFTLTYTDIDGDTPTSVTHVMDNTTRNMTSAGNGTPETGITYCLEITMAGYGRHNYTMNVSDGENSTSVSGYVYVNTPPSLANISFEPEQPVSMEDITFSVNYTDPDGDAAQSVLLWIKNNDTGDKNNYSMSQQQAGNGSTTYALTTQLMRGNYTFWFTASDGLNTTNTTPASIIVKNAPPTVNITKVESLGNSLYRIMWTDYDPDDNATLKIYISTNQSFSAQNATLIAVVGEGEDGTNNTYVWNATDTPGGEYYVTITASDPWNTTASTYPSSILINHPPVVENLTIAGMDGDGYADSNATIKWKATDPDTNTSLNDTVTVDIYYDTDTTPGGWGVIAMDMLASGTFVWNTALIAEGTYYVVSVARDGQGEESPPLYAGPLEIWHPSIQITLYAEPNPATPGALVGVNGTVKIAETGGGVETEVQVILSGDGVVEMASANTDVDGNYYVTITAPQTEYDYALTASTVFHGKTYQNTITLRVVPESIAELHFVGQVTVDPQQPITGKHVTITAVVENAGTTTASTIVALYVDGETDPTDETSLIIPAGDTDIASLDWTPSTDGDHALLLAIDPYNRVEESDETNNNLSITVTSVSLPDLSVSSYNIVLSNDEPIEGDDVGVVVRVYNTGRAECTAEVEIYMDTRNSDPIKTESVTVAPGGYAEITFTWSNVTAGQHTIIVVADPTNNVEEINESNNQAVLPVTVASASETTSPPAGTSSGTGLYIAAIILIAGIVAALYIKYTQSGGERKSTPRIDKESTKGSGSGGEEKTGRSPEQ